MKNYYVVSRRQRFEPSNNIRYLRYKTHKNPRFAKSSEADDGLGIHYFVRKRDALMAAHNVVTKSKSVDRYNYIFGVELA